MVGEEAGRAKRSYSFKNLCWGIEERMVLTGGLGVKGGFYIICCCFLMDETFRAMAECDLVPGSGEGISFALWEGHFSGVESVAWGKGPVRPLLQRGWERCWP